MKIAKFIVLGALLGTMTNTEVVEAVQLQSLSHSYIEVADKDKSHKKHIEDEWYKNMRATLNEVGLLSAFSAKYKIAKEEPVYDETGVARADFS